MPLGVLPSESESSGKETGCVLGLLGGYFQRFSLGRIYYEEAI